MDQIYMSQTKIKKLADQSAELVSIIDKMSSLDDWMESHITQASTLIDSVYDKLKYSKEPITPDMYHYTRNEQVRISRVSEQAFTNFGTDNIEVSQQTEVAPTSTMSMIEFLELPHFSDLEQAMQALDNLEHGQSYTMQISEDADISLLVDENYVHASYKEFNMDFDKAEFISELSNIVNMYDAVVEKTKIKETETIELENSNSIKKFNQFFEIEEEKSEVTLD